MLRQVRDADLHLLRVFAAVAESGGLSAAQERLNVAASTISTQISTLESRLGFRLCERGRAGFSLTSEGQIVLESAYKLFRNLGEFLHTVEAMKGNLVGVLRIVLLDNIVQNPALKLSEALAFFSRRQPFVQFEISQLPPGQLENAVLKREADIGIAWTGSSLASLTLIKLFEEQQIICCGRGNPLFKSAPDEITERQLEEADWVRRGYRLPRDFPYSTPPVSTATAYHMESVAHFILAGTHIGYLPRHYAERWIAEDLVRPILPKSQGHKLNFHFISRSDAKDERIIAAMRQALVEAHKPETS